MKATILLLIFTIMTTSVTANELFIDYPETLINLEKEGLSFPKWLCSGSHTNNKELYEKCLAYRSIVDSITADLDGIKDSDQSLSVTMAKSHRLFDKKWFYSKNAFYQLVGIVNRLDRLSFAKNTCGETRLIYRLAYKKNNIQSRLPLTFNVVFWNKKIAGCKKFTQLVSQPKVSDLKSIELNMQSVRWPSTIRPDMGGYAEYLLRVFIKAGNHFELGHLENTPDIRDKKQFLNWLKGNLHDLDQGNLKIPNQFLAKKITSVALHGKTRAFNKPFDRYLTEGDFHNIDFKEFRTFKTPFALKRRLNDLSCAGCHQGKSVAGFHFLGKDRNNTSPVNAIVSSQSSHFNKDQDRRLNFLRAVKNSKPLNHFRPFSDRASTEDNGYGAHCSMGIDDSFKAWSCAQGLSCQTYDLPAGAPVGVCYEQERMGVGSPCEVGTYKTHANPHKDRLVDKKNLSCDEGLHCEVSRVGFPGGMCSGKCQGQEHSSCGSIAILYGFNKCLSQNKPFDYCLKNNVRPAALRSCDSRTSCRDDYICAKANGPKGVCIPPYFLFQLRLDGHPSP